KVIREADGLHGAEVDIKAGVKNLEVDDSVLGSMRFLRDRELEVSIPTVVQTRNIQVLNGALVFHRRSLNGLFEYILRIMPTGDTKLVKNGNHYRLISKGEVRFRLQGLTSERPLTPISPKDVFK